MAKELLNIALKWLAGDELDVLAPIIEARGWMPLNKALTRALAAYDERGNLIGCYILKLLPHPEPLFVEPAWRGSGVADALAEEMHRVLADTPPGGVWFTAENPLTARMAEEHGLVLVNYPVYTNGESHGR